MSLRDQRQLEYANVWLKSKFGILNLCPRFGKIKTAINCLNAMNEPKTLIVYPVETIKKSWQDDFIKWGYKGHVSYCTTASLWKLAESPEYYDVMIMDEVQMFSPANLKEMKALIDFGNTQVMGLSGTISIKTEKEIMEAIKLPILAEYSIDKGIRERVITDYKIHVVMTDLDYTEKYIIPSKKYPNFKVTEFDRYNYITKQIEELKEENRYDNEAARVSAELAGVPYERIPVDLGLLPLQRMHILKKSRAKLAMTKWLMNRYKGERLLIFCGVTEIADSLSVPVYHSKNKDEEVKDAFCAGVGDILATVDMFEAGVTIKPINRAILNSFDSNPENLAQRISRLTGFEYNSPEKVAMIYIICTNTVERDWLEKALEFFDLTKVTYYANK